MQTVLLFRSVQINTETKTRAILYTIETGCPSTPPLPTVLAIPFSKKQNNNNNRIHIFFGVCVCVCACSKTRESLRIFQCAHWRYSVVHRSYQLQSQSLSLQPSNILLFIFFFVKNIHHTHQKRP